MGKKNKSETKEVVVDKRDHNRWKQLNTSIDQLTTEVQTQQGMRAFLFREYVKGNEQIIRADVETGTLTVRKEQKNEPSGD